MLKVVIILMVHPAVITFSVVSLGSETSDYSLLGESLFNFGVPHMIGEDFRVLLQGIVFRLVGYFYAFFEYT